MNNIYENTYIKVLYNQNEQLVYFEYSSKTENMDVEEYTLILKDFIEIMYQYRPKKILGNMAHFNFIIAPDFQEWINENLFSAYATIALDKIAIISSHEYISSLSIEQTMEEDSAQSYKFEYFKDNKDAEAWLMAT